MSFTDPKVIHILAKAAKLVAEADALGVSLRIDRVPVHPLAMGNARHVVDAWPARHQPAPPARREISDREWAAQPANMREGCTVRVPGVGEL